MAQDTLARVLALSAGKGEKGDPGPMGPKGEDGTQVTVSETGTATDEVKYITIDGTEYKLAGSGTGGEGFTVIYYDNSGTIPSEDLAKINANPESVLIAVATTEGGPQTTAYYAFSGKWSIGITNLYKYKSMYNSADWDITVDTLTVNSANGNVVDNTTTIPQYMAGENIIIDGNVISATGGGGEVDPEFIKSVVAEGSQDLEYNGNDVHTVYGGGFTAEWISEDQSDMVATDNMSFGVIIKEELKNLIIDAADDSSMVHIMLQDTSTEEVLIDYDGNFYHSDDGYVNANIMSVYDEPGVVRYDPNTNKLIVFIFEPGRIVAGHSYYINVLKEVRVITPIDNTFINIDNDTIVINGEGKLSAAGGGGSSYTFTDGLTETDGTVSWDLNDYIKKTGTKSGDTTYNNAYTFYGGNYNTYAKPAVILLAPGDGRPQAFKPASITTNETADTIIVKTNDYNTYMTLTIDKKNNYVSAYNSATSDHRVDLGRSAQPFKDVYATTLHIGNTTLTEEQLQALLALLG